MSQAQSHPSPTDSQLIDAMVTAERRTLRNTLSAVTETILAQVTISTSSILLADSLLDVIDHQADPQTFRTTLLERLQ